MTCSFSNSNSTVFLFTLEGPYWVLGGQRFPPGNFLFCLRFYLAPLSSWPNFCPQAMGTCSPGEGKGEPRSFTGHLFLGCWRPCMYVPCARSVCWHVSFSSWQSPLAHACLSAEKAQAVWSSPEGVGSSRASFLICQSFWGWLGGSYSPLKVGVPLLWDGRGLGGLGEPKTQGRDAH